MSTTQDTGLDWVRGIVQDIKKLHENIAGLQDTVVNLRSSIDLEQKTRVGDIDILHNLHERLSQKAAADTELRCSALERRATDFESKTELWVGGLGKANMATKEQLGNHDTAISERARLHAAVDDRVAKLEQILPSKCTIIALDELARKVAVLEGDVDRDRASASAGIKEVHAKEAQDIGALQERLDRVQYQIDTNKRVLTTDLSNLTAKVEALEAFSQTRAKAADVQALEFKVQEALERSLETITAEVSRKAATTTVNAISERLTNFSMEVQANQARAQADMDALGTKFTSQISTLEQNLGKQERQLNLDREAHSACWVALEKEINTKALKTDVDALCTRVNTTETAIAPLAPSIATKCEIEEVVQLKARTQALEEVYASKADASDVAKMNLIVADHVAKHETHLRRQEEHTTRLEKLDGQLQDHGPRFDATEKRTRELGEALESKVDTEQVHTKDRTELLLKDFYHKEEIDAMLVRVWWRVGEMSKSPKVATPLHAR